MGRAIPRPISPRVRWTSRSRVGTPSDSLRGNNTGPDLYYDVYWQGNRVFRSSTCRNALVGHWSEAELDLGELLQGVSNARNQKAALIRPGATVSIRVWDKDIIDDDPIGAWEYTVGSDASAAESLIYPSPAVKYAKVRVVELAKDTGR